MRTERSEIKGSSPQENALWIETSLLDLATRFIDKLPTRVKTLLNRFENKLVSRLKLKQEMLYALDEKRFSTSKTSPNDDGKWTMTNYTLADHYGLENARDYFPNMTDSELRGLHRAYVFGYNGITLSIVRDPVGRISSTISHIGEVPEKDFQYVMKIRQDPFINQLVRNLLDPNMSQN